MFTCQSSEELRFLPVSQHCPSHLDFLALWWLSQPSLPRGCPSCGLGPTELCPWRLEVEPWYQVLQVGGVTLAHLCYWKHWNLLGKAADMSRLQRYFLSIKVSRGTSMERWQDAYGLEQDPEQWRGKGQVWCYCECTGLMEVRPDRVSKMALNNGVILREGGLLRLSLPGNLRPKASTLGAPEQESKNWRSWWTLFFWTWATLICMIAINLSAKILRKTDALQTHE